VVADTAGGYSDGLGAEKATATLWPLDWLDEVVELFGGEYFPDFGRVLKAARRGMMRTRAALLPRIVVRRTSVPATGPCVVMMRARVRVRLRIGRGCHSVQSPSCANDPSLRSALHSVWILGVAGRAFLAPAACSRTSSLASQLG
jgi:hypothetical protein